MLYFVLRPRKYKTVADKLLPYKTRGHSQATPPHSQATPPHSQATPPHSQATPPHSQATPPHSQATPPIPGTSHREPHEDSTRFHRYEWSVDHRHDISNLPLPCRGVVWLPRLPGSGIGKHHTESAHKYVVRGEEGRGEERRGEERRGED